MGLLVIVLFKCSFKRFSLNFRAQNRREGNFSTVCLAAVCFLSTHCRMIKRRSAGHAIESLSYVGLNTVDYVVTLTSICGLQRPFSG